MSELSNAHTYVENEQQVGTVMHVGIILQWKLPIWQVGIIHIYITYGKYICTLAHANLFSKLEPHVT